MNYVVGIDLGTTNCAVAYVSRGELKKRAPEISLLSIPQLTRPGAAEARPLLPSFVYQPAPKELPSGSTVLPWDRTNKLVVGELARALGAKVPGRLVASAKSWLCSNSVDRTAAILPWGAPEDVKRLSPVAASAQYLAHIRDAWDHAIAKGRKEHRLANQELMLTVPASFDEAARELTVEAANQAELPNVTLIEEPQAAFYAWIAENSNALQKKLADIRCVLICDVGGGTTDFSLIDVACAEEVQLTRRAVGDHLMLGGDNMDLALARFLEKKFPGHLDAHQFRTLTAVAREGKERLFGNVGPASVPAGRDAGPTAKVPVTIVGRGSAVVGGTVRTDLTRAEAEHVLLDGFFPRAKYTDNPSTTGRSGIREWGLPYVHDPAVTRHLSQFLRHHLKGTAAPDAVLFNGGATKPAAFRARVLKVLHEWFGREQPPVELHNPSPDLSVAVGAAYYGCVRHGKGVRIGGGIGRAYYIGIETDLVRGKGSAKVALCLVPHGTEEGAALELPQVFTLRPGEPIVFPLFASSVRTDDALGSLVSEDSPELLPLPPLETVLQAKPGAARKDVPVRLNARLTEVGTLAITLKAVASPQTWEVHLNVRAKVASARP